MKSYRLLSLPERSPEQHEGQKVVRGERWKRSKWRKVKREESQEECVQRRLWSASDSRAEPDRTRLQGDQGGEGGGGRAEGEETGQRKERGQREERETQSASRGQCNLTDWVSPDSVQ